MKQGPVDRLFIRQELRSSHPPVMEQEGAAILLNGHDPLSRQPHHDRGKRPIVKPDRAILDTPEIAQSGGGIPSRGFMFRASVSLVAIPPHQ